MPFPPHILRLAGMTAALLLTAAAPADRLPYDPGVFLAGECLSPHVSGCGTPAPPSVISRSASEALLDAGREPRLELDMAVLLDIGPELSGGGATSAPLAR